MLKQRVITALILAPLVLAGIIMLRPESFAIAAAVVIVLGAWEWADLSGLSPSKKVIYLLILIALLVALTAVADQFRIWLLYLAVPLWFLLLYWVKAYPGSSSYWCASWSRALLGLAILLPAWAGLTLLKQQRSDGLFILLLMLIIWGADIGAYFSGRAWGKAKLAPEVSPGKTWAGVYGGMTSSLLICWLFASLFGVMQVRSATDWLLFALLAAVTAAVSVLGDLTESMVKRHRGVKDSGRLLPGHGGVMDRIDSLVAGLPFYTLLIIQIGQH